MLPANRRGSRAATVRDPSSAVAGRVVRARLLVFLAVLLAVLQGCRRAAPPPPDAAPPIPQPSTSVLTEGSSPERAWVDARSGDPLELARLANLEGAHKLAEVAGNEHASAEDRATAIRAIAMASDPTPALEVLARTVTDPVVERSVLALQTLAYVAPRRSPIEELEPAGWRWVADAVSGALKSFQDPVRRELSIRVLHSLVDRGVVARASIPAR